MQSSYVSILEIEDFKLLELHKNLYCITRLNQFKKFIKTKNKAYAIKKFETYIKNK